MHTIRKRGREPVVFDGADRRKVVLNQYMNDVSPEDWLAAKRNPHVLRLIACRKLKLMPPKRSKLEQDKEDATISAQTQARLELAREEAAARAAKHAADKEAAKEGFLGFVKRGQEFVF